MKNFFKVLVSSLFILSLTSMNALGIEATPTVQAEGMILIDAATGEILAEKNAHTKLAPASTTKIMTALLVLENTKLDEMVTVGPNPPFADGSSIALKEGDVYSVENLLHALILESSNDSAMALAEHISGSEQEFAKLMTKRAKELGAKNTNFVTASGLYSDDHYSTAYDLSLIMREALKNKDYVRISQIISYELPVSKVDGQTKWVNNSTTMYNPNNSNYYEPLVAAKTGYTQLAQCSYVAAAEKDGQMLISTLLKSENKVDNFKDTIALFDYGFANYDLIKLYNKGDIVTNITVNETDIPLLTSDDVFYLVDRNSDALSRGVKTLNEAGVTPNLKLEQKDLTKTSFKEGDEILSTEVLINNEVVAKIPLISGATLKYSPMQGIKNIFKSNLLVIGLGILIFFVATFIIRDKFIHFRYRRKAKKISFRSKKRNKLHW
ncbi:MAG: serine hydrolase [Sarcina sp.]